MKFLLAFACILATAMASPVYGGYGAAAPVSSYAAPALPIGLYQVSRLAPAAVSYAAAPAPVAPIAPAASYGGVASGYGNAGANDGEILQLAKLALSLPSPPADLSSGNYGHAAVKAAY